MREESTVIRLKKSLTEKDAVWWVNNIFKGKIKKIIYRTVFMEQMKTPVFVHFQTFVKGLHISANSYF